MSSNLQISKRDSSASSDSGPHLVPVHRDAHLVQFYHSDEFLSATVARFLSEGLQAGDAIAIIATPAHRKAFASRLQSLGYDIERAVADGRATVLDARETLSKFMIDGRPDAKSFRTVIGGVLEKPATTGRVRAYGEMVDLLWRDGNPTAAIALEELWNDLQHDHRFTLLCAYLMGSFYKQAAGLHDVCAAHGHVLPPESEGAPVANLVDVSTNRLDPATAAEIAHRKELERALRESLRELRRAESDLREKQEELTDFVENAAVGLHWIGRDGTILWANQAELELLGYERAEYIGRHIADVHADQVVIDDILSRLARDETLHGYEARLRAKDGSIRHVVITSNVYRRDGEFRHTRCFTRDITERKLLEIAREAAAKRSERLVKITAAIADAITAEQVYQALVDQVAAALNASSASLWLVDESQRTAELSRSVGFLEAAKRQLQCVPLDVANHLPATDTIRSGRPIWIRSKQELLQNYPHLAPLVSSGRSYRVACLPIIVHGRTLGALAFTFDDAPPIDDDERTFLMLVARYSGQALERLRLLETEKHFRSRAESSAARMAVLNRATRAFADSKLPLSDLLQTIAEQVTVEYADGCGIMLTSDDGELCLAGFHHRNPELSQMVRALAKSFPSKVGEGVTGRVAATGETIFLPHVDAASLLAATPAKHRAWVEQNMPGSLAVIPLRTGGKIIGTIGALRHVGSSPFTEEDRQLLEELAERAAMAVERSRLYDENRQARLRAELLYRLVGGVVDAECVDDVFAAAIDAIGKALQAERSSILVFDAAGRMRFRAWRGLSDEYRRAVDGHSPWSKDARNPQPILVGSVETDPSMAPYLPIFRGEGIAALAFIPLVAAGRLIGKFMVYYGQPHDFSTHEFEMATAIANHVASAIARFAAVDELKQSVHFNEMFTGILGHDLRNPLAGIMASAQTLLRRSETERMAKPLTRIVQSGERMARMIDQLLDFTRARIGAGIPVDPKAADLCPIVQQVVGELRDANPGLSLDIRSVGDTAGVWDADRLCQVMSNLIGNAVQHGNREHGIDVHIDGTARDLVRIEVHNMGMVPSEVVPKLFDPMTPSAERREKSSGLGLGLFITQQIVSAHGGKIDVTSDEATGTRFAVSLPREAIAAERG